MEVFLTFCYILICFFVLLYLYQIAINSLEGLFNDNQHHGPLLASQKTWYQSTPHRQTTTRESNLWKKQRNQSSRSRKIHVQTQPKLQTSPIRRSHVQNRHSQKTKVMSCPTHSNVETANTLNLNTTIAPVQDTANDTHQLVLVPHQHQENIPITPTGLS